MSKVPKELQMAMMARERKKRLKRDILFDKLGIETPEQFRERKDREMDEAYEAVPLDTKQRFLDLFNKGKTLGEAAQEAGIDMMVASQVILRNAVELIPTKAVK